MIINNVHAAKHIALQETEKNKNTRQKKQLKKQPFLLKKVNIIQYQL